ncbi:MAG: outer membrane lipid asymmetry maintenance protein MlaD [Gammaproteobacteria bacterium]|jgi:phospholipid/cholesterol/gamma-HCH transport system substrate-binding protein|nr:outer membrane lipid asymmetry maintenance protein MlaD [Gammaproteobacteria bacterium]MBT5221873.1 outer membrane lipid asymmetry maintenance protein MlaD [Gammaproteobacteria bacterium]MBT5824899.1 outer membrane lipid asymmetry maintenance protein MlaD [Gammaproteobacteria bacterium]MBT5967054.1 outer membrane lipid asymmetry maintenance protein MlaD [Gammaproteobacteria bacterium]MBT6419074.1 outer membrane lipid asymmetry maintenance protein MlaD [Gammaproteobacteria bacterium]
MPCKPLEILVGLFVSLCIAALFFLALQVSNYSDLQDNGSYTVNAHFENVGGLKSKALVSMAGVPIGRVTEISFDSDNYDALVKIRIDARYNNLPSDTSASILTSGLLGDKYIGLTPGGLDEFLQEGDNIELTQSALVLERLISQFLFNSADDDK